MAINSFKVKNSLNLQPMETAPASPSLGDVYCNTEGNILRWDGSDWVELSSGGSSGRNYLSQWFDGSKPVGSVQNSVGDTIGSSTRSNPDQWGSSDTSLLTVTNTSTNPIREDSSLQISHVANGAAFIETPLFTLDRADLTASLMATLLNSGVSAANDYDMYLVRYNSSNVLQERIAIQSGVMSTGTPSTAMLQPGSQVYSSGGFWLTGNDSTDQYALRIRRLNASAASILVDSLKVGPQDEQIIGPAITSPQKAGFIATAARPGDFDGWLSCDGRAVSRTTYSSLFAAIGITHGQGDGSTTFNIPDYRGRFLRHVDGGANRDPDKAGRTAMASGGNTGNNVGSVQTSQYASHTHTQNSHNHTQNAHSHTMAHNHAFSGSSITKGGYGGPVDNTRIAVGDSASSWGTYIPSGSIGGSSAANTGNATATNIATTATNQNSGGNETRPINAYVNYLIKTEDDVSNVTLANRIQYEYLYNTGNVTAAASGDTTSFGYGYMGTPFLNYNATSANTRTFFRVRSQQPIAPTDKVSVEISRNGDIWIDAESVIPRVHQGNWAYGMFYSYVAGNTDIDVSFYNGGPYSTNTTYAAAGASWNAFVTDGWRWRVTIARDKGALAGPINSRNIVADTSGTAIPQGMLGSEIESNVTGNITGSTVIGTYTDITSINIPTAGVYEFTLDASAVILGATGSGGVGMCWLLALTDASNNVITSRFNGFANATTPTSLSHTSFTHTMVVTAPGTYKMRFAPTPNSGTPTITNLALIAGSGRPAVLKAEKK